MFQWLRTSARWVCGLSIAMLFGFAAASLPSWYGYIGVPFAFVIYALLPAGLIFLFLFINGFVTAVRERRAGRGVPDYPVDDVVLALVCAGAVLLLFLFDL